MGQAREAMDRATKAALSNNFEELGSVYAEDAEVVTPDQGTITGRQAIVAYFAGLSTAFPEGGFEVLHQHETADTAIDEGYSRGRTAARLTPAMGSPSPPRTSRFVSASVTLPR